MLEIPTQWLAEITNAVTLRIEEQENWVTLEGLAHRLGCEPSDICELLQRTLPVRRVTMGDSSRGRDRHV